MKIISWNVNGIRAHVKKGAFDWTLNESPDIFCLQETKAHPDQLTKDVVSPQGYTSYFDHSKVKKGYSGVAVYSKVVPEKVEYGLGIEDLDQEGRQIALFFKGKNTKWVLVNTYFPNGGGGEERIAFKLRYYDAFLAYIEDLKKKGYAIVFTGDVNTAHTESDLSRPKENQNTTGFLPIERAWIDEVISAGYVDTFRLKHPEKKNAYTWWDMKTFARERNIGWRIDYFFVNKESAPLVNKAEIFHDVLGSDHCPIFLEINI